MNTKFSKFTLENSKSIWPLLLIFFTSTDTVMFGTNSNAIFLYVPRIIGVLLIIYVLIKRRGVLNFNRKYIFVPLMIVSIILTSSLINEAEFGTFSSRLIAVLTGFAIVSYFRYQDFVIAYDKFMFLISIVAIITNIVALVTPNIILSAPKIINTSNNVFSYFAIGGVMVSYIVNNTIVRASSIFWEPGAYAIYLIIAIYFQLFASVRISIKKTIVYIVCLIITFSTTGYIALGVLLIAFIINNDDSYLSKRIKSASIIFLIFFIAIIFIGQDTYIYQLVFQKIVDRQSTSVTRYASIINGLQIGLDYPLVGISPNNMRAFMADYARKTTLFNFGANPMNTNTVSYQFAAYGVIFGSLFTMGTFKFFTQNISSMITSALLILTILLAYSGEAFYSYLPFTIMFYGFNSSINLRSGVYNDKNSCN